MAVISKDSECACDEGYECRVCEEQRRLDEIRWEMYEDRAAEEQRIQDSINQFGRYEEIDYD